MATHVLVVGAGASAHYEFPLARGIVEEICYDRTHLSHAQLRQIGIDPEAFTTFANRLMIADPSSVDLFAEYLSQPADFRMAKALIAYCLGRREQKTRLYKNQPDHWLRALGDSLIGLKLERFPERDIAIVTFNYERTIEQYLYSRMVELFKDQHPMAEIKAAFLRMQVVHIYGQLGPLPGFGLNGEAEREFAPVANTEQLEVAIRGIHLLPELKRDPALGARATAHGLIKDATKAVSFLGFAYSQENLEALDFKTTRTDKLVYGTRYKLTGQKYDEVTARLAEMDATFTQPIDATVYEAIDTFPHWLLGPPRT